MSIFIVNFKTYPESTGEQAMHLMEEISAAAGEYNVETIICAQGADLHRLSSLDTNLTIWAQHFDPVQPGRFTGHTTAHAIAANAATGSLLNHSEKQLPLEQIAQAIIHAKEHNLSSCVCVPNAEVAAQVIELSPDHIAFEPPELISTGKSILEVDPSVAEDFVSRIKPQLENIILGAGVSTKQDVIGALELGFQGVLLASAITKATDPMTVTKELLSAFNE